MQKKVILYPKIQKTLKNTSVLCEANIEHVNFANLLL
jgi:hypothetical protein